jgi:hypothetical protein
VRSVSANVGSLSKTSTLMAIQALEISLERPQAD